MRGIVSNSLGRWGGHGAGGPRAIRIGQEVGRGVLWRAWQFREANSLLSVRLASSWAAWAVRGQDELVKVERFRSTMVHFNMLFLSKYIFKKMAKSISQYVQKQYNTYFK